MSKSKKQKQEYDLKKSVASVGYLYPILKTADGEIIAGQSRLEADPEWPTEVRKELDSPLKVALARLIENLHRRSLPEAEKRKTLNAIAEALLVEGFEGTLVKEIAKRLAIKESWVRKYLSEKFKQMKFTGKAIGPDEAIRAALERGDPVRKIKKDHKCGQHRIERIKHELEAAPVAKAVEAAPVVETVEVIPGETIATAETPIEGISATITEETLEGEPYDPLEGLKPSEASAMMDFQSCVNEFLQNCAEVPLAEMTDYGQSLHGNIKQLLEARPFSVYEEHNL